MLYEVITVYCVATNGRYSTTNHLDLTFSNAAETPQLSLGDHESTATNGVGLHLVSFDPAHTALTYSIDGGSYQSITVAADSYNFV